MSAYIQGKEAASVDILGKQAFAMYQPYRPESLPSGDFEAAFYDAGDGLADGEVPEGYVPDTTGYTAIAITNDSELQSFLSDNTGKYGYLTTNITTGINYGNGYTLNGILDGCGHLITNNNYRNTSDDKDFSFGGLIDSIVATGVCKNLKLLCAGNYTNTRGNTETNHANRVGLLVGNLKGSVVNCYITWNVNWEFFDARYSGHNKVILGGVCAQLEGGSIISSTVDFQQDFVIKCRDFTGLALNKYWYMWLGGFTGEVNGAGAVLKNLTITGNSTLKAYQPSKNRGGGYARVGAIAGWITSAANTIDLDGIKVIGTFNLISDGRDAQSRGLLIGGWEDDNKRSTCSFLLYNNNASNWCNTFGLAEWMCGTDKNSAVANPRQFAIADDKIGFCHSQDKVWIGEPSKFSTGNGYFTTTLTINNAILSGPALAKYGSKRYIPALNKSAITGDVTGYSLGYYGYISNEAVSGGRKIYYKNGTKTYTGALPATVPSYDAYESQTIDNIDFYLIKNTNINYYN